MRAGKLRHRVTIQSPPSTRNEYGEEEQDSDDWTTFARVWAAVIPLSGRELWNAQQVQGDVTHRVEIRYLQGINPKMRVKFGERFLNIASVMNLDERNVEMHLMCMERV